MIEAKGLADTWPDEGPEKIWRRELGDGYSTIAVDSEVLYTMYRTNQDEFTVALDRMTGETIWEHRIPSPTTAQMDQYGPGPHSTPLIVGKHVFTIGSNAVIHCFDKRNGKVLWKHDLIDEYGGPVAGYGYACSPIAYNHTVIVPLHRERPREQAGADGEEAEEAKDEESENTPTLVAFDRATGEVVWEQPGHDVHYASPILIEHDGEEQLVLLGQREMVGLDPTSGELRWKHEFDPGGYHCAPPLAISDDLLFVSSAYGVGSRVVRLTERDGKTVPEQLWHSKKLRIHHANAISIGDYVYGSSGDMGMALMVGMNAKTGKTVWRERGFAKATLVYADGKLIILDEDGQLALTTVTPEGLTVHSRCEIAKPTSWAAPTLVGTTLYVRDREHIMALDLE
jgi:outer membrane protein assembly factor BamB